MGDSVVFFPEEDERQKMKLMQKKDLLKNRKPILDATFTQNPKWSPKNNNRYAFEGTINNAEVDPNFLRKPRPTTPSSQTPPPNYVQMNKKSLGIGNPASFYLQTKKDYSAKNIMKNNLHSNFLELKMKNSEKLTPFEQMFVSTRYGSASARPQSALNNQKNKENDTKKNIQMPYTSRSDTQKLSSSFNLNNSFESASVSSKSKSSASIRHKSIMEACNKEIWDLLYSSALHKEDKHEQSETYSQYIKEEGNDQFDDATSFISQQSWKPKGVFKNMSTEEYLSKRKPSQYSLHFSPLTSNSRRSCSTEPEFDFRARTPQTPGTLVNPMVKLEYIKKTSSSRPTTPAQRTVHEGEIIIACHKTQRAPL